MWRTTKGSLKQNTSNGHQQKEDREKAAFLLTVGGFELLDVLMVFNSSSREG